MNAIHDTPPVSSKQDASLHAEDCAAWAAVEAALHACI